MNSHSNQELIEAAVLGETAAIDALLLVCQPDLMKFARKVCASPEDAEDAVQETLWILSRKIGTLRTVSAFAGWLFRIVKNECYRLLKRGLKEDELNPDTEPAYLPADLDVQAALKRDVIAAIADLAPHYRQVIIMRDIEDMTAPEVAAALGLTVEAVKSRLHRARLALRVRLRHWIELA